MIYKNDKPTTSITYNNKIITYVYVGSRLVWEFIRSCFSKGYWVNTQPWSNKDGWKNNT